MDTVRDDIVAWKEHRRKIDDRLVRAVVPVHAYVTEPGMYIPHSINTNCTPRAFTLYLACCWLTGSPTVDLKASPTK